MPLPFVYFKKYRHYSINALPIKYKPKTAAFPLFAINCSYSSSRGTPCPSSAGPSDPGRTDLTVDANRTAQCKGPVFSRKRGLISLFLFSQTTWALIRFVLPARPMGTPAVMTTVCPPSTAPSFSAVCTHMEKRRSVEST